MNDPRVSRMPRLPLARGPEHDAWVIDSTPTKWLRETYTPTTAPYTYTPAGQIVRLAMPTRGVVRYPALMKRLTDRVHRMQVCGDLPDVFAGAEDWTDEDRALVVLATVLVERGTPFYVIKIEPNGRVWTVLDMEHHLSMHPDAPQPGGA